MNRPSAGTVVHFCARAVIAETDVTIAETDMTITFSHVDAFTSDPFGGNPAVVCRVADWPPTDWMQRVASELNAPATAFVCARADRHLELRWFSPSVELEMCGHGTLATAHVLWES